VRTDAPVYIRVFSHCSLLPLKFLCYDHHTFLGDTIFDIFVFINQDKGGSVQTSKKVQ
jgi:hypothetical protein